MSVASGANDATTRPATDSTPSTTNGGAATATTNDYAATGFATTTPTVGSTSTTATAATTIWATETNIHNCC